METEEKKVHGRRRAGGRHGDPLVWNSAVDTGKAKPRGRHAAHHFGETEAVPIVVEEKKETIPPKPSQPPITGSIPKVVVSEVVERVDVPDNTGPLTAVQRSVPATVSEGTLFIRPRRMKMLGRTATAITTTGLILLAGTVGAQMHATAGLKSKKSEANASQALVPSDLELEPDEVVDDAITAPVDVIVEAQEVDVATEPAPVIVEPEPVVEPVKPAAPTPVPAPIASATPVAPAPTPAIVGGKGQIVASAALGQIGVFQDCTRLATNSLAAAGVHFHGWPWEYASLGVNVGVANAQPGDLLLYAAQNGMPAHIAVYIGNGQAVHGGWNGNETRVWSTMVGQPAFGPYAAIRAA